MRPELKYGLIGGAAIILWELGEYLMGFHDVKIKWMPLIGLVAIFVPFIVLFFGILEKRKSMPGRFMTLREGIKAGLIMAILMASISGAFFYIYTVAINPNYLENRTEFVRKSMYDKLIASNRAESPEQARRVSIESSPIPTHVGGAMYYVMLRTSIGLMLSVLVSVVLRANPPEGYREALEAKENIDSIGEEEDDDES